MTKQGKWKTEFPIEVCATTYKSLAKALGGLKNKLEIPDAAREFVKHSAAAAKDRQHRSTRGRQQGDGRRRGGSCQRGEWRGRRQSQGR